MDIEEIAERAPEALKADGFDDCIIGLCDRYGQDTIIAYDTEKMLQKMVKDGMTYEEAREYFDFNIIGAFMGEGTPCFIDT